MSGVTPREPARSGDEQDVIVAHWRRMFCWTARPGVAAMVKRQIRRRERHNAKAEVRRRAADLDD
jgi:hypothetical protein